MIVKQRFHHLILYLGLLALALPIVPFISVAGAQESNYLDRVNARYAEQSEIIEKRAEEASYNVVVDYALSLKELRDRAQAAGALEALLQIQNEIDSLTETKEIGKMVGDSSIEQLKQLVAAYKPRILAACKQADETKSGLDASYIRVLKSHMADLTREGKIEEAILVRERILKVEAASAAEAGAKRAEGAPPAIKAAEGKWAELPMDSDSISDFIKDAIDQPRAFVRVVIHDSAIKSIYLGKCDLATLEDLAGCPTEELHLHRINGMININALQSMPNLKQFSFQSTIEDVSVLRELRLEHLDAEGLRQHQLKDILALPLHHLSINLKNIPEPVPEVARLPLRSLELAHAPIADNWKKVIKALPNLSQLQLQNTPVEDLSFIRGKRLTSLTIANAKELTNLAPLSGMPLQNLSLSGCETIFDLRALKGLPLKTLNIERTAVDNRNLPIIAFLPLERLIAHDLDLDWTKLYLHTTIRDIAGAPKDLRRKLEGMRREKEKEKRRRQ